MDIKKPYLAAAPGAGLLVSDLALDGGRVQELQHLGAAQAVGRAAVLLVVARTTDNLPWGKNYRYVNSVYIIVVL